MSRSPTLRLKILELFAFENKPISNKMIRERIGHYDADISHAIRDLLQNKLIEGPYRTSFVINRLKGRPQKGYKINKQGMEFLLSKCGPEKFWEILCTYIYVGNKVDFQVVQKWYDRFLYNNLGYSNLYLFNFMLDSVNLFCDEWYKDIQRNGKDRQIDWKILETLAIKGCQTVTELSNYINANSHTIKQIILRYSSIKSNTGKARLLSNSTYLSHTIQLINSDTGENKFQLTLIGVLLVLYVVRRLDMDNSKKFSLNINYDLEEYYFKISSNYRDKLPLIFGKWSKLRELFGIMNIFNFDIVLDMNFRVDSLTLSGNYILYSSIKNIFGNCKATLSNFQGNGIIQILNIEGKNSLSHNSDSRRKLIKIIRNKLTPVIELWCKLTYMMYENEKDFEGAKEQLKDVFELEEDTIAGLSSIFSIERIEYCLSNEIAALYYMNLNDSYLLCFRHSSNYRHSITNQNYHFTQFPSRKLSYLLEEDEVISGFIKNTFQDALEYHSRQGEMIKNLIPTKYI